MAILLFQRLGNVNMLCESRIVPKTKTKRQNYELKIVFIYNY